MRGRSVMGYPGAIRMQDILEETKGGSLHYRSFEV